MNHVISVLSLALSFAIPSAPTFAGDSPQPASGLQWGPIAGGLQLAATPELDAGVLHCWIRNGQRDEVSYNSYFVGYWECVSVEYRSGSDWQRLKRIKDDFRLFKGAGPSERDARKLAPLQTIENGWGSLSDARLGPPAPGSRNPVVLLHREDVPQPSVLRSTFVVDLGDFVWPTGLLERPVEVRVVQMMWGPGQAEKIRVDSPSLVLEGTAIQRFLDNLQKGGRDPIPPINR